MLPYTTSLTRGQGAAGVSQLQRSHRRRRGEVPERLAGRRPLGLGEALARRDHYEQRSEWVGLARNLPGAVREADAREGQAEVLEVQLFLRAVRRQLLRTLDAMTTHASRWPRADAAAARARIWDERRSAAAAREASMFRRHLMKARVRTFVLFARRQLTKFTSAESCRVLDMVFLEPGIFLGLEHCSMFHLSNNEIRVPS